MFHSCTCVHNLFCIQYISSVHMYTLYIVRVHANIVLMLLLRKYKPIGPKTSPPQIFLPNQAHLKRKGNWNWIILIHFYCKNFNYNEKQQIEEDNYKQFSLHYTSHEVADDKKNTCSVDKISIIPDCFSYHHHHQQHHYCHPSLLL